MRTPRKYIDPLLTTLDMPAFKPTCPMPTLEQLRNRQRERLYREHLAFCSRWAVQHG